MSNINSVLIAASILMIALFGYRQFNQWTDVETRSDNSDSELLAFAPPRSFTSLARFVAISVLYCLTLIMFYLGLYFIFRNPGAWGADFLKVGGVTPENAWLVALFVVTGLSPILPVFSNVERAVRQLMHAWAVVPTKAHQMADELASPATRFELDETYLQDTVLPRVEPLFNRGDFAEERASTIAQKWCRLAYLLYKFAPPAQAGLAGRSVRSPYAIRLQKDIEELRRDMAEAARADAAVLRSRGGSPLALSERIDAMLHRLYVLMSCRAFGAARSLDGVVLHFKQNYGVQVQRIELALFPTGPVFDALAAVAGSVFVVSLVFWLFHPEAQNQVHPVVWSLSSLACHGLGVLVGWLVFTHRRRQFLGAGGYLGVGGPLSRGHLIVTVLFSFALAMLPIWPTSVYYLQQGGAAVGGSSELAENMLRALDLGWPWGFLGVATAIAVFIHLERTANRDASWRLALVSGLSQAAANAGIALLILVLHPVPGPGNVPPTLAQELASPVIQLVLLLTATIGMTLGIFLPRAVHGHGFDKRGGAMRFRVPDAATRAAVFTFNGRQYPCELESISQTGCLLRPSGTGLRTAAQGVGSVTLSDRTAVPARVVREIKSEAKAGEPAASAYAIEFTTEPNNRYLPPRLRKRLRDFVAAPGLEPVAFA